MLVERTSHYSAMSRNAAERKCGRIYIYGGQTQIAIYCGCFCLASRDFNRTAISHFCTSTGLDCPISDLTYQFGLTAQRMFVTTILWFITKHARRFQIIKVNIFLR